MRRHRLLFISGWAFPASALVPFAHALNPVFETVVLSAQSVFKEASEKASSPGQVVREHLETLECTAMGGWSLGGMLALASVQAGAAPDKLFLISSTPKFSSDEGYTAGYPPDGLTHLDSLFQSGPAAALHAFFKLASAPDSRLPSASAVDHALGDEAKALSAGLAYLRDADLRNGLKKVSMPVHIFHGTRDRVIPFSAGVYLSEHIPSSQLHRIEGAGHLLPITRCAEVAGLMKEATA